MSHSITTAGIDRILEFNAESSISMLIIIGTISGCGGGVLFKFLGFDSTFKLDDDDKYSKVGAEGELYNRFPDNLIHPTLYVIMLSLIYSIVKCSFFASILYVVLTDPLGFIFGHAVAEKVYLN